MYYTNCQWLAKVNPKLTKTLANSVCVSSNDWWDPPSPSQRPSTCCTSPGSPWSAWSCCWCSWGWSWSLSRAPWLGKQTVILITGPGRKKRLGKESRTQICLVVDKFNMATAFHRWDQVALENPKVWFFEGSAQIAGPRRRHIWKKPLVQTFITGTTNR
jgi:hypothetical protein